MRTRGLRRPIVFLRFRCSILILLIKISRCSLRSLQDRSLQHTGCIYRIGHTIHYSTTQIYSDVSFWLNYLIKLEYTIKVCYKRREYFFEDETCRHTMLIGFAYANISHVQPKSQNHNKKRVPHNQMQKSGNVIHHTNTSFSRGINLRALHIADSISNTYREKHTQPHK